MDVIRELYWTDTPIDTALQILLSRGVSITREQIEQLYEWYGHEDTCKCHTCNIGRVSYKYIPE